MRREAMIPDAIIAQAVSITPEAMAAPAQLQVRSSIGRMMAVEQLRTVTAEGIMTATVRGVATAAALHEAIQPHEAGLAAINDNVVAAAAIGVNNAAMLILQESQATAAEIAAIARRGRERLATMPDAAFVALTLRDRVGAWCRGTYADLELRPGTPRLTLWQDIKQLVVGGVVERICDEYDQRQIAERKADLARAVAEEMALLEARAAATGLPDAAADPSADGAEADETVVSQLIDDVLKQSRRRAKQPVYAEVVS